MVGCGSYECADDGSRICEVAMAVADEMHSRGVGTLLLEHLISLARSRGVHAFTAETLVENALMLQVFADAGLPVHRTLADGVYDFTFPLPAGEADAALGTYRDAVAERERIRRRGQPAARAGPGLGRGHRREPAPRVDRPGHPAEHHQRQLPRPGLRGQPGRGRTERRPVRAIGGRAARTSRPGGHYRAGGCRTRYRRAMRAAGGQGPGGDHGGPGRCGPRGAAGHLPPPRHAAGRARLLRRRQHQHGPGRDVRRPPSRAG